MLVMTMWVLTDVAATLYSTCYCAVDCRIISVAVTVHIGLYNLPCYQGVSRKIMRNKSVKRW